MSQTETPQTSRPRPAVLVAGGLALVILVVLWMRLSASPVPPPSNPVRAPRTQAGTVKGPSGTAPSDPAALRIRLDALKQPAPEPGTTERNPFRFQPKAPPPPPSATTNPLSASGRPPAPIGPPPPPPLPPIPIKFMGTVEGRGVGKVAVFTDARGAPFYAKEGELVLGQYRVVRIGIESVVMEYADGRGRQTIPMRGQ